MIIGVDVGYTYTKFCTELCGMFKSTIKPGKIAINKSTVVEYEGNLYTIGEKGEYSVDFNKINDLTFKLCLYTAIARNMENSSENIYLVTGLPIGYYRSQKKKLYDSLIDSNIHIKYNGKEKYFIIKKCTIFPQSAGMFVLEPDKFKGDNLIIDIGGMTVDVSYFEDMKLVKYATYNLGMLKLYSKISQEFIGHEIDYNPLDIERKFRNGFENQDKVIDLQKFIKNHTEEIIRSIKLDFPYRTSKKHLSEVEHSN